MDLTPSARRVATSLARNSTSVIQFLCRAFHVGPSQGHGEPPQAWGDVRRGDYRFADPLALIVEDAVHASRSLIIGESVLRRILVTVFVECSEEETRIVSARRATRHERRRYEEGETA